MKVNETRTGDVNRPDSSRDDVRDTGDRKGRFSKAMDKARERREDEAKPPAAGAQPAAQQQRGMEVSGASAAEGAAGARLAEDLAKEIVLVEKGADSQQVSIQFDSKTLDGLRVEIERGGGLLSVKLYSKSDEATRLVSANADRLAQALQAKGLPLSTIQVQGPNRREETRRYHHREGRQGGGQQQGGRQKQ